MRTLYLMLMVSLIALTANAEAISYCYAYERTPQNQTFPISCNSVNVYSASIAASGGSLSVQLNDFIYGDIDAIDPNDKIYMREGQFVRAAGYFVVHGGTGNAELFSPNVYTDDGAGGYSSNIVTALIRDPGGNGPFAFPFTFNVPFFLYISDSILYQTGYFTSSYFHNEWVLNVNGRFSIQTLDGAPIPGAYIEQTTPEPRFAFLMLSAIAVMLHRKRPLAAV